MRAIRIYVYRNTKTGDCTNGGISQKNDELYLLCKDGNVELDPLNLPENTVQMVTKMVWGGHTHTYLRPVKEPDNGCVGWMAGGNLGYTSDSRFAFDYPLAIHDRQETTALYEILSR